MRSMLVGVAVQLRHHGPGAAALADLLEAVALVEPKSRVVGLDAERDLLEPVALRLREQAAEKLVAVALAAARRHDGDRQLGRLFVDEAVAGLALLEEPVPGGADVAGIAVRDHRGVAGPAPAPHVPLDGALHRILRHVLAPVVRVVEHVAEKARVVAAAGANHGASLNRSVRNRRFRAYGPTRSWANWMRLPSGS